MTTFHDTPAGPGAIAPGQHYRLPSRSVVNVVQLFGAESVGCRYIEVGRGFQRSPAELIDVRLTVEFLTRYGAAA